MELTNEIMHDRIKHYKLKNMYSKMYITLSGHLIDDKYYYFIKKYGSYYNDIDNYYFEDYIDFQNFYMDSLNDTLYDCRLGKDIKNILYRVHDYVQ